MLQVWIIMRLKQAPVTAVDLPDVQVNTGAPPLGFFDLSRARVVAPVGLQPVGHDDAVNSEYLEGFDEIREERVHVVVTKSEGVVVKRLLNRISERGKLVLKSDTIAHRKEFPA